MGESMVGQCEIGSQQKRIKRGKQLIYLALVKLKAYRIPMGESMVGQCGIGSQQKLVERGKQLTYLALV